MRPNRLRTLWQSGGKPPSTAGWRSPTASRAEIMAHQGWDTLTIDLQHGVVDYQAMVTMLQAISHHAPRCRWCACRGSSPAS